MHETRSSDAALVASVHKLLAAKALWLTASPYRGFGGASKCFGSSFDATMASHFDRIWQQPNVWPPGHWTITQARWNNIHTCLCAPGGTPMTYAMWIQMGYPACELAKVDTFITSFQKSCRAFNPACAIHANIEWVFGLEKNQGHGRVVDYMNVDKKLAHDFGRFADR
ncbi:MAG: hypothetical protein KAI47_08965, partial [Deltaproteobacteria bacterium]|nr:hypothetical protein [Deltaproteobacteria bacterium]